MDSASTRSYERRGLLGRLLSWIWFEIVWLSGLTVLLVCVGVMSAKLFTIMSILQYNPEKYGPGATIFLHWIFSWSQLHIPISVRYPNLIWPIGFLLGAIVFAVYCPWKTPRILVCVAFAVIAIVPFWYFS